MPLPAYMMAFPQTQVGREQVFTFHKDHILAQIEACKAGWKDLAKTYHDLPLSTRCDMRLPSSVQRFNAVAVFEHLASLPEDADFSEANIGQVTAQADLDDTLPFSVDVPYTPAWYEDIFEAEAAFREDSSTGQIYHFLILAEENLKAAEALLDVIKRPTEVRPFDRPARSMLKGWNEMCRLVKSGQPINNTTTGRAAMVTELDLGLGNSSQSQNGKNWFEAEVQPPPVDWSRRSTTPAIPIPIGDPGQAMEILDPAFQSKRNATLFQQYNAMWEGLAPHSSMIPYPSTTMNKIFMTSTWSPAHPGILKYNNALPKEQLAKLSAAKFYCSAFHIPVFRTEAGELRLSCLSKMDAVQQLKAQLDVEEERWSESNIGMHHGRAGDEKLEPEVASVPENVGVRMAVQELQQACEEWGQWATEHGDEDD